MSKRFPWFLSSFELEGLAAAAGFWLLGVLMGLLWGPLFWIGFIGAVVCLLGARKAKRTPPSDPSAIVAPCDGVIVEIGEAAALAELRLRNGVRRFVRISSSPTSSTGVYAPMAGGLETLVREEGDPSRALAFSADVFGLSVVYFSVSSGETDVGVRLATGGLGPRLDLAFEAGDAVQTGRIIGKRRLGGWCDVYLPEGQSASLEPGMTVVGGETRLSVSHDAALEDTLHAGVDEDVMAPIDATVEPIEDSVQSPVEDEDVSGSVARLRETIETSDD